jgi:multisubunit Na+/H+ antiporter MnhG subunit
MTLSVLAILLGLIISVPSIYGLLKPADFTQKVRAFPRSVTWGCFLMLLATVWFNWNLKNESIADFEPLKPLLYALFFAVGVGACIFVRDFLAARGAAVVMLLLAKLVCDTARWVQTDWRLVLVVMAYIWVVLGIWFTISPWRMRDIINWSTANPARTKTVNLVRIVFGALIILVGVTVLRTAA